MVYSLLLSGWNISRKFILSCFLFPFSLKVDQFLNQFGHPAIALASKWPKFKLIIIFCVRRRRHFESNVKFAEELAAGMWCDVRSTHDLNAWVSVDRILEMMRMLSQIDILLCWSCLPCWVEKCIFIVKYRDQPLHQLSPFININNNEKRVRGWFCSWISSKLPTWSSLPRTKRGTKIIWSRKRTWTNDGYL